MSAGGGLTTRGHVQTVTPRRDGDAVGNGFLDAFDCVRLVFGKGVVGQPDTTSCRCRPARSRTIRSSSFQLAKIASKEVRAGQSNRELCDRGSEGQRTPTDTVIWSGLSKPRPITVLVSDRHGAGQAIRRVARTASTSNTTARATKMPVSMPWKSQNRSAGW